MKESVFANEIKTACELLGGFFCKIPDSAVQSRFIPQKPFDSFCLYNGSMVAMEFKMVKTKLSFPFEKVKPHQIKALIKFKDQGGEAYIIINYRFIEEANGKRKRYNKVFFIDVDQFIDIKNGFSKKSIPLSYLEETCNQIDKINKVWDVNVLFPHYRNS